MYNSTEIAKRIKTIAKMRSISIKEVLKNAGLGLNTMSNMKTSMPKADNLARIADCLDCSIDYLLCRTENANINKFSLSGENSIDLTPEEQYLIDIYRRADDRGKRNILRLVQGEDQEAGPPASGTGFADIVS